MVRHRARADELLTHAHFVRSLARSLVQDEERAADIAHETWLAALRARTPRAWRPWLATVIRNRARRLFRDERRRARRERAAARPEHLPSAAERAAREELLRSVVTAVLDLDEPYRSTVLEHYYEGLDHHAIAQRASVSIETVRSRLKRARAQLRHRLARTHGNESWACALAALAGVELGGRRVAAAFYGGGLAMSKKTVIPIVLILVLLTGGLLLWNGGCEAPSEHAGHSFREAIEQAPVGKLDDTGAAPKAPATAHRVGGHVHTTEGEPFVGATIFVGGKTNPFDNDAECTGINYGFGRMRGRYVTTDEDGAYAVDFSGRRENVFVCIHVMPAYRCQPWKHYFASTPARDLDFTVAPQLTAMIEARVYELPSRTPVEKFKCSIASAPGTPAHATTLAREGVWRFTISMPPGTAEANTLVALLEPRGARERLRRLVVRPGDVVNLEFLIDLEDLPVIRGRVVDARGNPLRGAVAYLGGPLRARGDEPFKPFQPSRISDKAETDAEGRFELRGSGERATVWHPEHSPVTVPVGATDEVALPPRGAIAGRLVDEAGGPVAGVEIRLDREPAVRTDANGAFRFERLEAGAHGLFLPKRRVVVVRVAAGERHEITVGPGIASVEIAITSAQKPFTGAIKGLLIGLDRFGSIQPVDGSEGVVRASGVLPGRYLLATRDGAIGQLQITGPHCRLEFGDASLRIRAAPGASVSVVPTDADPLVRLLVARNSRLRVPASGELVVSPLPTGRFDVGAGTHDLRPKATVTIDGPGAEVRLKD